MSLINCEASILLNWSKNYFLIASVGANQDSTFTTTHTEFYAPVITLPTQGDVKILKQLESGFKRSTNWNKYRSIITTQAQNRYLELLLDPGFQGVHRLRAIFSSNHRNKKLLCYDRWKKCFWSTTKNDFRVYDKIQKIGTGQGDHSTTGCLCLLLHFENYYKLIVTDIRKQQNLDAGLDDELDDGYHSSLAFLIKKASGWATKLRMI